MTLQERLQDIQDDINEVISKKESVGSLSDGYHTFNDLYRHRIVLFIAFAKIKSGTFTPVWRSQVMSDGTPVQEGWFLLGIDKKAGKQITYHLPLSEWDKCKWATELKKAPEFDGHTSAEVLERIGKL